jgi:hypothetical protein
MDTGEFTDFCLPNDGGDTFLRNIFSYKITRHSIPENVIINSHSRENLKSYIALNDWAL